MNPIMSTCCNHTFLFVFVVELWWAPSCPHVAPIDSIMSIIPHVATTIMPVTVVGLLALCVHSMSQFGSSQLCLPKRNCKKPIRT